MIKIHDAESEAVWLAALRVESGIRYKEETQIVTRKKVIEDLEIG